MAIVCSITYIQVLEIRLLSKFSDYISIVKILNQYSRDQS